MASALEEPTMRKTLGFCFLSLTLIAGTAHAQGVFLEKGQPGISAVAGAAVIGTGWSASVVPSYTYRGVFDVGLDVTNYSYSNGDAKRLSAIGLMPFTNIYFSRAEDGRLPVSLSGTFAFQKRLFRGNGGAPNPDEWGMLLGASVFRRIEFSNSFAGIPEVFVAYDLQATTWHSTTREGNAAARPGQETNYDNKPRAFFRANLAFKGEKIVYAASPYLGYQGGLAIGANLGAIF
jgi:hypothetical protein